ncbi:methyl-accepting chemotaxis protein [Marinospirillum sp. MEB164]|uniref:Methyl-accepting chemotaxis protein n=1 Tax=Marinospirillum alkalitolerans TaxID=3123374 RepID=A0ABW8PV12_9GAMM
MSTFLSGLFFLTLGLSYVMVIKGQLEKTAMHQRGSELELILNERLRAKEEFGLGLAVMLADNPRLKNAFFSGLRGPALHELERIIETFRETTNYRGLRVQLHTDDGRSWLRSWNPDNYADDLRFRPSIQLMLAEQRPFGTSDEAGRAGFAVRGLAPIVDAGDYLGSLEVLQGVGSISRDFEQDGGVYLLLLAGDLVEQSPALASNQRMQNYILANNRWFNERAIQFAQGLDLAALDQQGQQLTADWFVTRVAVKDEAGQVIGMHIIGEPASLIHAQVKQATQIAWLFIALLCALVLGMILTILWTIQRSVVRPISRSVAKLRTMGKDLTVRLKPGADDELGELLTAFNHHTATLSGVIGEVSATAQDLAVSAEQMMEKSQQGREMAQQQRQETDLVASASNQMAASASGMTEHAQATLEAAEEARLKTQQGQEVIGSTIDAIQQLANKMNQMLAVIARLDEGSRNIGQVIETIAAVAEQTNLLALNAAIEAARAGEHGRGFAVVADEVRQLASRTQAATHEIQAIIQQVQTAASDVSQAIHSGTEEAQQCAQWASDAGRSLDDIAERVCRVNTRGEQITLAAAEQSQVAEEINASIQRVRDQAETTSHNMEEAQNLNDQLAQRAHQLEKLVQGFRIG